MTADWHRILPDEDFRFHMGLRQGSGAEFFAPSEEAAAIRAQRAALLRESGEHCAVLPSPAPPALEEALTVLSGWTGESFPDAIAAGSYCEPDWLVLAPDEVGALRVAAGVVCFPSSWSLPEKTGLPVGEVHGPVPGLNASLGRSIDTFLARLVPGAAWLRDNWGLSADTELDHHPRHRRSPLRTEALLNSTWLRLEQQLLTKLAGGGVLFGIRVSNHRLDLLAQQPGVAARLGRALESMPPEIAVYKGISAARNNLAAQLRGVP
jgi:dimethylamine monooxygenase subunit A